MNNISLGQYCFYNPSLINKIFTIDYNKNTSLELGERNENTDDSLLKNKKNFIRKTNGDFTYEKTHTFRKYLDPENLIQRQNYKVINNKTGKTIFIKNDVPCYNYDFSKDSIYFSDYNFDGYPDLLINMDINYNNLLLYLYNPEIDSFQLQTLIQKMNDIEINLVKETISGVIIEYEKKPHEYYWNSSNNKEIISKTKYLLIGKDYQYVMIEKIYYNKKVNDRIDTNYCKNNDNNQLINVSKSEFNNYLNQHKAILDHKKSLKTIKIVKEIPPFKFVLEKNCKGINLPSEKGYYANKTIVYKNNEIIDSVISVGNSIKQNKECADSLQINDYNFDGYPDFRVCTNSFLNNHTYYIYNVKKNKFIVEKTLSELNELNFDFNNKIATGKSNIIPHIHSLPWSYPFQYYIETLKFEGNSLENLTINTTNYGEIIDEKNITETAKYINQKRIYTGDTMAIKMLKNNSLTKSVGTFKFIMEYNPEEIKPQGNAKGAYVKRLNIYNKEKLIGQFEKHGNYFNEVPHWLDSLEISDFNFDGFQDIRIYNSNPYFKDRYSYILYKIENGVQSFYEDELFSSMVESEFLQNQKTIKGKIISANTTIHILLKNDTLTLTEQDNQLKKSPIIQKFIYKNGSKKAINEIVQNLEKDKQFGDYNFDGYEDFRQQNKVKQGFWNVYIYNRGKEAYELDTLLSKFEIFNYDINERTLKGSYSFNSNVKNWNTYLYQWSFKDNKMILYQKITCITSSNCTISTLKDGKWIDTLISKDIKD